MIELFVELRQLSTGGHCVPSHEERRLHQAEAALEQQIAGESLQSHRKQHSHVGEEVAAVTCALIVEFFLWMSEQSRQFGG